MKDIFFYPLFTIDDAEIAPINFILIGLIIVVTFIAQKFINKYFGKTLKSHNLKTGKKERNLYKLVKQILYFISLLLVFQSFGVNNDKLGVSNLLTHNFIELKEPFSFEVSLGIILFNIILLYIARFVFQLSRVIILNYLKEKDWISEYNQYTFVTLSKYFIYVLAGIISLQSFAIDLLIVGSSLVGFGVALALGLREFFTDIVSGFILLFEGTIRVKDIVELDGQVAKVEKISIRSSIIKTREGKILHVPNSKLTEETVINWTSSDEITRFTISVGVAYGSNVELVKDVLYQCTMKHPKVDKHHPVSVLMKDFGDNGLLFEVYFWANRTWEMEFIKSDIRYAIEDAFKQQNIQIPFPQRDLHIVSNKTKQNFD